MWQQLEEQRFGERRNDEHDTDEHDTDDVDITLGFGGGQAVRRSQGHLAGRCA
jgi:hypothetical protein